MSRNFKKIAVASALVAATTLPNVAVKLPALAVEI